MKSIEDKIRTIISLGKNQFNSFAYR